MSIGPSGSTRTLLVVRGRGGGPTSDGRLLCCDGCGCQAIVCSHCDHGQRYCSEACREKARRESILGAGRRYQQTKAGRENHARRQKEYRFRKAEGRGVTHQGSLGGGSCRRVVPWLLKRLLLPQSSIFRASMPDYPCCHFCGEVIKGGFLRSDFRRRRGGVRDPARGRC
jgi:hypothetical protein